MTEITGSLLLDRLRAEDKLPALSTAGALIQRMRRVGESNAAAVAEAIGGDARLEEQLRELGGRTEVPSRNPADDLRWFVADQGSGPVRLSALALSTLSCNPVGSCEEFVDSEDI